ncbi:MAG: hypothetical protein HC771_17585 [Synechococcales cyanobacterium CRU_2_2]|nr:hypothetical protein [Synechococcales cyanobacterium CRU_2_2]
MQKCTSKNRQDLGKAVLLANKRLKSARLRVAVQVLGDSLYLRATLPHPQALGAPTQQRIALNLKATRANVDRAEDQAKVLAGQLVAGVFDWGHWREDLSAAIAVTDWIAKFEQRMKPTVSPTTWDDYRKAFSKLPKTQPLTGPLLERILSDQALTPRTQLLCYQKFRQLAKFAGVECDLSHLRGNYGPKLLDARSLPSDADILQAWEGIPDPGWQWAMGMLAAFGLRNHEIFYLDLESLLSGGYSVWVREGKTGPRTAWACPPDWLDLLHLRRPVMPPVVAVTHQGYGRRVSKYLCRARLGFSAYDLRHAWAIRAELAGMPGMLAAAAQGHSQRVHEQTYQRWLQPGTQQRAYLAAMGLA